MGDADKQEESIVIELGETGIFNDKIQSIPRYSEPTNPPPYQARQARPSQRSAYFADGTPYYERPSSQRASTASDRVSVANEQRDSYFAGVFTPGFDSVKIRNRFVQRVYTILTIQLLVTFGFVLLVIFENNTRHFFIENSLVLMLVSLILFFIFYMVLICCENLRRTFPTNYIFLGILTILMAVVLASISSHAATKIVLYSIGTTTLVCLVVSLFACQTKWDVTGCGMCLCIATLILMLFGMIVMIMHLCGYHYRILDIVYSSIATLLFCFWLMYDTQQIVGGRRVELSPEEYIVGALSLYVDVVYIFMNILSIFTLCSR